MLSRRRRAEQGAVAIITAVSISAFLLVVSAMVVDLGLLRVDRQTDKSAADAAALAGANGLISNVNAPVFRPFAGVCQALSYLRANASGLSTITGSWSDGSSTAVIAPNCSNPADPQLAKVCQFNDRTTWARFTGTTADGRTSVAIQSGYDVTGDSLDDLSGGRFPEENLPAYQGDTGTPTDPSATDYKGCENLAVILGDVRNTKLGVQAVKQMHTRIRSVGRVTISPPQSPYSLLILEQHDCQVLTNGNNGVAAIDVRGYKSHPGLIHSDSDGLGANCNKQIIVGQKADGIVAHEAPDTGAPGQVSTVASANQSDGLTNVYAGPKPPGSGPVQAGLATRQVVDQIYLNGVRTAVSASSPAWSAVASFTAPLDTFGSVPGPWTVINSCPTGDVTATKVLVKCSNWTGTVRFANATDIIVKGTLGGGSSTVQMPQAQNVYVSGDSSPNGTGASTGTALSMHNYGASTCPSSYTPTGTRAKLFIYAGSLTVSGGSFQACNTTVILMSNRDDACLPSTTPTYFADDKPCGGAYGNGIVNMSGNGTVDWTAPNLIDDETQASQTAHDALEDLALWSEAGSTQGLGGSGIVHLAGVFSAPNASPLKLNGNPTWQVLNSQYVVRKLENDGGAVFTMMPSPTLPVAPPTVTFNLVR